MNESSARARHRLRLWLWTLAALTLAVLVVGGITRLTRSGLSIVEWQPVTGVLPPLDHEHWVAAFERYQQFPEYRQLRRGMTLGEFQRIFLWEYAHRLLARLIGVVFLVPFLVFWRAGYFTPGLARRALALFALGGLQGALGWAMVKSGLIDRPSVSHYRLAAHLVVAVLIIGYAVWLARDLAPAGPRPPLDAAARRVVRRSLTMTGAILAAQIVWGAFVAGLKAGFLFNTFPLMGGQVLPPGGLALEPRLLNLVANQATVQWLHRVLGTLLLAAIGFFAVRARRVPDATLRRLAWTLLSLAIAQYGLGIVTLVFRLPLAAAAAHQALAVVLAAVWVAALHRAVRAPRADPALLGGHLLEPGAVGDHEAVLHRSDDARLAPAAHDPDGGLDGRAGEIRELLT
jgi:cytochrome c oxidase assembly protein subunit 15